MGYAFISYSTKNQSSADAIRSLFKKYNINTWMAPYNIPAGSEYAEVLYDALTNCSCLVLLLTNDSQNSQWVRKEVNIAVSNGKTVIPVKLENVELNSSMKLYLNDQQIVPVHVLDDTSDEVKRIIAGVTALVENDTAVPPVYVKPEENNEPKETTPKADAIKKEAPKKNNKKLFLIAGIAVALIAAIAITVFALSGGKDEPPKNENGETTVPETNAPEETAPPLPVEMSDEIADFTFELEGAVYKLPCRFSDFAENGWTISSTGDSTETTIPGLDDVSIQLSKDGKKIYVNAYNYSGNTKKIKDCMIGLVEFQTYYGTDHKIAKGISTKSNVDEIKEAFGIPTNSNTGSSYETLTYSFDDSYLSFVKFNIDSDPKYSTIQLKNYVKTDADKTETNTAAPLYLNDYKAPSELGNDPTSARFSLDGKTYQLPVPVNTLITDGWSIIQQPGYVVSGGTNYITLQKNGKNFEVSIANFAEYQTTPQNCVINGITAHIDEKLDITLPGVTSAIALGIKADELKAQLTAAFSLYEGSLSNSYSYYEYDPRDLSVYLSVNRESGILESLTLECDTFSN